MTSLRDSTLSVEISDLTAVGAGIQILNPPSFPVETWEAIFYNVTRPGDLYNLCLVSRYICNIATPILYGQLFFDQNPYLVFTLARLRRDPSLLARVTNVTLLPRVSRALPDGIHTEAETLWKAMDIQNALRMRPNAYQLTLIADMIIERSEAVPWLPNLIYFFPEVFTSLTTFKLCGGCLPAHFLSFIFNLPRLLTLHVRDTMIPHDLESGIPSIPLPLRELVVKGCKAKSDRLETSAALAKGLLRSSPYLTSLTIDPFIELAAFVLLSNHESPPPIRTLNCHGLSSHHTDCTIMCGALAALPTIISLHMAHTPRELSLLLPSSCLPNLRTLTGQIKSLVVYTFLRRPLQYLTITDAALPSGGVTWETHLILFLESLSHIGTELKGLAFNVAGWSEELFLCVCHLWPGLKELTIQCTSGNGVDEYFRISFGPRFLPQLPSLEVLQIFEKNLKHGFTKCRVSKGVPVYTDSPAALASLSADELDELTETPIHLRRWEKLNPNLRVVAFDRESWWRRIDPGGWVLRRDPLPVLMEE